MTGGDDRPTFDPMRRTLVRRLIAATPATLLVATAGSPAGAGGSVCGSPQAITVNITSVGGECSNTTPEVPTVELALVDTGELPHSIDFVFPDLGRGLSLG